METETVDNIKVKIGPVTHKNPVFIASGICGYGEEYSPLVGISGLGGVVTKTVPFPGMSYGSSQRLARHH